MEETTLWIIIIGVIGAFFILSPFFSKKRLEEEAVDSNERIQKREQVFAQLRDLEYDYQMNKLSEQDYKMTKTELTARAAQYLAPQTIDYEQIENEIDEEIEQLLERKLFHSGEEGHYEK